MISNRCRDLAKHSVHFGLFHLGSNQPLLCVKTSKIHRENVGESQYLFVRSGLRPTVILRVHIVRSLAGHNTCKAQQVDSKKIRFPERFLHRGETETLCQCTTPTPR